MNKTLNKTQKSINFNKFFFELKRTPFIKRYVSDFIYDRYDLKNHWFFNPYLFNNIIHVFTKTFYVSFVALLGMLMGIGAQELGLTYELSDTFLLIWFMFLAIGSLNYSTNFTSDTIKTYLISFRLPFKNYFKHHLKTLGFDRLIYMIVMGIILLLLKIPRVNVFLVVLTIMMMFIYTIVKQIHYAFKYQKKKPNRFSNLKANPLDGFALVVFVGILLFFKATITLLCINGYFIFWLIIYYRKYKGIDFYEAYHRVLVMKFKENESLLSTSNDIAVEQVKVQSLEDLEVTDFNIDDYRGYDLFNELFIRRLSFLWEKNFKRLRLGISAILGILYVVLLSFPKAKEIVLKGDIHSAMLSIYIFFLYISEIGKRLTQAYYYNADYSLLHYPFYFEKENLWRQFIVRFKTIFKIHLYVSGPLLIFSWIYTFTFKPHIPLDLQIRFTLVVLALMMFVSIFDLALYYLMQPFTKSLNVDNKVYLTVYTLVYFILYMLKIDVNNIIHVSLTLGVTVFSFVGSIVAVYLFSYKTFKYKE